MKNMTLKDYRVKRKLTREEASKQANITVTYLYLLENNKKQPSLELINKLAEIYKTKPVNIFLSIV